jgi:RNA polymerase sigma factor (sigma-70 family)
MASEMTDSELLQRYLAEGDEAGFASLVERHLPLVYGTAMRRLNNPVPAQEVAQNVFITLARRAVWLTEHPSLAGWLYRTAIHLAQHQARDEQRRRQREQTAIELGTTMKVDDSLLSKIAPVLDEALLELGDADREALLLRFFAGKPMREIGVSLGVREEAAQKRVARALDALAERFRRRGFRVAGAAALATALQQASASAVPAGLAGAATKAALGAGATAWINSIAVPVTKIMTLTKLQTAAVCIAVAALPLCYEWHALNGALQAREQLNHQLQALQTEALARGGDQSGAEQRLPDPQRQLIARTSSSQPANHNQASARTSGNPYLWDENSPYVRVPRQMLSQVRFAPYATRVARDGKAERYQLPPLAGDGTPQPPMEAALGLSADEAQQLRQICQDVFAQFFKLEADHSELKSEPLGKNPAMKLKISAFPDEGARLEDQFKQQLAGLLGPERSDAFWQQAAPMFTSLLNDFGAYPRQFQLIRNDIARSLELLDSYRNSNSIGVLDLQRNGVPLPPALQAYADTWAREMAAQASSQPPQQQ